MKREPKLLSPTGYDNRHRPLHSKEQKENARRVAGGRATKQARENRPVWNPDQAIEGLKRILGEVYG